MAIDIRKLLKSVVAHGASDLHLLANTEPQIRLDGRLRPVNLDPLTPQELEEMCYSIITEKQKKVYEEAGELDFAIFVPDVGRFRGNYYKSMGHIAAAFRIIPSEIPSLDDLKSPEIYKKLVKRERIDFSNWTYRIR